MFSVWVLGTAGCVRVNEVCPLTLINRKPNLEVLLWNEGFVPAMTSLSFTLCWRDQSCGKMLKPQFVSTRWELFFNFVS